MKRSISILVICALALNGAAVRAEETVRYAAVETVESSRELSGSFVSTLAGESAICVTGGTLLLQDASIVRCSDTEADETAVRSGAGAAVLAAGGRVDVRSSAIDTDAPGAAGLFAAADGEVVAADVAVDTGRDGSAGIAASGGVLRAENLRVTTGGNGSPAIRLDSGGSASVEGGSYQTSGADSPAADASAEGQLRDAELTAGASEALRVHSGGNLLLQDCRVLGGAMTEKRGGIAAVVLCADGEDGARLEMAGGELSSRSGSLFCMEGGAGEILLCGVELDKEAEILLDCIGGAPGRATGAAIGRFTAIGQALGGDVRWNTGFGLELYLSEGSALSGAVYAGEDVASGGYCSLYIDASSRWIVTADSTLTNLSCAGEIVDADGRSVSIVGTDGTVYVQGEGDRSVTVERYSAECDMSGAGRRTEAAG
ncbi:MAG: hypothetical protein ACI4AL_03540 [Aristaeellaceae bacterium]